MDDSKSSNDSLISLIEVGENENDIAGDEKEKNKGNIVLKNIHRVVRNWRKCLACDEKNNLQRPSKKMRLYFCKMKRMYIEKNDRVCQFHAQPQNWNIRCKKTSVFTNKIVNEMVDFLLNSQSNEAIIEPPMNIGITVTELKQILFELGIPENPNKGQNIIVAAVNLYIERLHTGQTYKQMALRHKMSRISIGQMVKRGRNILLEHFVPSHLGYKNCTREWLLNHTTDFARMLYCNNDPNKCVVICDGTYIYTYSSTNYAHQRNTFSGQKKRHLFKIMKFVTVDGLIIDTFGPFRATQNDAQIINTIFEKSAFKCFLNAGDVVLVDRGFRDCIESFKKMKLDVRIPGFIRKGTHGQLTSKQCNESRLITKMRFVIELANGRMKMKWGLFNKIIPSILSTHLMSDYRIGAAILNSFGKLIVTDKNDYYDVAKQMLRNVDTKNELTQIINGNKFQKSRKHFESISSKQLFFPKFNEKQLKQFSLGNYSIKQAVSYTADILKKKKVFPIYQLPSVHVKSIFGEICENKHFEKPMLIFTKMDSRFRSSTVHDVYMLYNAIKTNREFLYYCTCQHGRRTVGCCCHVMTIVYYFGYARHLNIHFNPASHLDNFFDIDLC